MLKTNRFSLYPVLARHYCAMRKPGTSRLGFGTMLALFGIPALLGAASIFFQVKVPSSALTPALAAMGVLAGAFLSGFVLLMNTRMKIRDDESLSYRLGLARLVGQTAVTALYLVVICVAVIILGILLALSWGYLRTLPWGVSIGTGVLVAGLAHVAVTGMSFVRRLFGVYDHLFGSDFSPDLQVIRTDQEESRGRFDKQA
jgi:hypothetical protein